MSQKNIFNIKYNEVTNVDKKLPEVFANPIQKEFHNVQDVYYEGMRPSQRKNSVQDVVSKIRDIFSSKDFVYKKEVVLTMADGVMDTVVVGRTEQSLLTMNGEVIPIASIFDIEKK